MSSSSDSEFEDDVSSPISNEIYESDNEVPETL